MWKQQLTKHAEVEGQGMPDSSNGAQDDQNGKDGEA